MSLIESIKHLDKHKIMIFFLLNGRYLNLLIPEQRKQLEETDLLNDEVTQTVVTQHLIGIQEQLVPGMYFPTPMAREIKAGRLFSTELARKYYYYFIEVDEDQNWFLKGETVLGKVKQLFLENLQYQPLLNKYFVEYQVDNRWDLCYLNPKITPMVAQQLKVNSEGNPTLLLNNGKQDAALPTSFQLDDKEQLFCESECYGKVVFSEAGRYQVLSELVEDGEAFCINGVRFPLRFQ